MYIWLSRKEEIKVRIASTATTPNELCTDVGTYWRSAEPTRRLEPPEPEPIDGEDHWIVRQIVDSRRNNRKKGKPIEYLVLWEGYPDEEATWEPYENIKGTAEEALAAYWAKNPSAK